MYTTSNRTEYTGDARFTINANYTNPKSTISLGFTLVEGSEEILSNGEKLERGTDYQIDYFSGIIMLTGNIDPNSDLEISYDKHLTTRSPITTRSLTTGTPMIGAATTRTPKIAAATTGTPAASAKAAAPATSTTAVVQAQQVQLSAGALAQVLTGTEATVAGQTATLPGNIQAAVANNPAQVTATIMQQPTAVQAQVASLPTDALVSTQMTTLLNGIDTGQIPTWARGAVENVEKNLAQRGLSKSTIGRDALVNAIINSALPIAQSNATALQQRAAQNLSNQQQANLASSQNAQQLKLSLIHISEPTRPY